MQESRVSSMRSQRWVGASIACALVVGAALAAGAEMLTSPSYRHVHGTTVSVAANADRALTSAARWPSRCVMAIGQLGN